MSEYLFCRNCRTRFSIKGKEVVECPKCGATPDLPNEAKCPSCGNLSKLGTPFCPECGAALFKICSGCGKHGPVDAVFCAECGEKMSDYKAYLARKKEEQEEREVQEQASQARKGLAALVVLGLLLAGAWFFCIAPVIGWVEQTGGGSVLEAVQLSQAQIEATRQAEIAARTAPFEDIVVELGPIVSREYTVGHGVVSGESLTLYVVTEIVVRNEGIVPHRVLMSYRVGSSDTNYRNLTLPARGEASFQVRVRIGENIASGDITNPYTNRSLVWIPVVIEEVDGVLREDTVWEDRRQDWELSVTDDASLGEYIRVER